MVALRIAIADDERDMRDYLARSLPRLGHEVVAAVENGRQLVQAFETQHPELVITDVLMPELDGIDAVQQIWQQSELPIVFLSASQHNERLKSANAEHVIVSLQKPIRLPVLSRAIEIAHGKYLLQTRWLAAGVAGDDARTIHELLESAISMMQQQETLDELGAIQFLEAKQISLDAIRHWPTT
jgi:two-component system, response regulator PdtaR